MDNTYILSIEIQKLRLENDNLRLQNENLRLQNENLHLKSNQSNQSTVSDDNESIPSDLPLLEDIEYIEDIEENTYDNVYEDTIVNDSTNENDEDDEDDENDEFNKELDILLKLNLDYSSILECSVSNGEIDCSFTDKKLKYTTILREIWSFMPRQMIYDHSTFNCKDYYCNKNGYKWLYEIQLSVQLGNTKEILNEIIRMCNIMKYKLHLEIKLKNHHAVVIDFCNKLKYDIIYPKTTLSYDKYLYKNQFM